MYENDAKPEVDEKNDDILAQLSIKSRFVLLFGEINHTAARAACERLIVLSQESEEPIYVLISSPGGHVESGDAIHDMIKFVKAPVKTIGTGWVASAGTHIFLAADKENRLCLPNTRFMIHQPSGGMGGSASDITIQVKEMLRTRERVAKIVAKQTGQPIERVEADMDRDYWMSADEAVEYGIVSHIIETYDEI